MSLPLYCHGPVTWFENVPTVVVPALKDKMKYFLICEAATKLVLSRGTSLILPHQLSYTYSLSANMQAQGTPQSQSSIDREVDASVNFEQLPFGHFLFVSKKKHAHLHWEKIFPTLPWFWKQAEKWNRSACSKLPVLADDRPVQKKRKKLSIFADLIPLVGGGGVARTPEPHPLVTRMIESKTCTEKPVQMPSLQCGQEQGDRHARLSIPHSQAPQEVWSHRNWWATSHMKRTNKGAHSQKHCGTIGQKKSLSKIRSAPHGHSTTTTRTEQGGIAHNDNIKLETTPSTGIGRISATTKRAIPTLLRETKRTLLRELTILAIILQSARNIQA